MVTVNGEGVNAAGKTVMQYIEEAGYNAQRVVVEKNLVILKKDELSATVLEDGDTVEILNFVGGG
ncbi:MAG: sulfur carrier protein ThiS [Clostridia bacterium]|nr:sulfur carrier protein ThiS [Clostridia bacterium]